MLLESGVDFTKTDRKNEQVEARLDLQLRPYQEELAVWALRGYNTLIHAPSGAGTMLVAVKIIREHLLKNETGKVKARI